MLSKGLVLMMEQALSRIREWNICQGDQFLFLLEKKEKESKFPPIFTFRLYVKLPEIGRVDTANISFHATQESFELKIHGYNNANWM